MTKIDWNKPIESSTSGKPLRYLGKINNKDHNHVVAYSIGLIGQESVMFCDDFGLAPGYSFNVVNAKEYKELKLKLVIYEDGGFFVTYQESELHTIPIAIVPLDIKYYEGQGINE